VAASSLTDAFKNLSFDDVLERAGKVGSTYNNFQMEKALLEEQRDRTSVEAGVYIPGPSDAAYRTKGGGGKKGGGFQIGGMTVEPMHLAIAGAALLVLVM